MEFLLPLGGRCYWDEAKFMLRSLEENWEGDINLSIYCNEIPEWITNCNIVKIDRYYPTRLEKKYKSKKFENYFDTLNKLRCYVEDNQDKDCFVYVYDDVVLLKKINIIETYAQKKITPSEYRLMSKDRHGKTILEALAKGNFVEYNYETHLPRMFNNSNLLEMFCHYPFDKLDIPYAPSTLYYNIYHKNPIELVKTNNIKAGFYGDPDAGNGYVVRSEDELESVIKNKTWINYNDRGLNWRDSNGNEILKSWLNKKYPQKSRFEL